MPGIPYDITICYEEGDRIGSPYGCATTIITIVDPENQF
jgi:hypothetical protein